MKTRLILTLAFALVLATAGTGLADVHYVDVNSTNATPPYTNWTTAATSIQYAVNAAAAGDEVVVTNGTYHGPVSIGPIVVRSVNGPQATTIDAGKVGRCARLADAATLSGFTLRNGYADVSYGYGGGGVWCESSNSVVSNCVIRDNQIVGAPGRSPSTVHLYGGGAWGGTLNNCTLVNNSIRVRIEIYIPNGGQYISGAGGGAAS